MEVENSGLLQLPDVILCEIVKYMKRTHTLPFALTSKTALGAVKTVYGDEIETSMACFLQNPALREFGRSVCKTWKRELNPVFTIPPSEKEIEEYIQSTEIPLKLKNLKWNRKILKRNPHLLKMPEVYLSGTTFIIGDTGSGKSSIAQRIGKDIYKEPYPTLAPTLDIITFSLRKEWLVELKLQIMDFSFLIPDTAKIFLDPPYQTYKDKTEKAVLIVLCFDISDRRTLSSLQDRGQWRNVINEKGRDKSLIIVGSKKDKDREVPYSTAAALAHDLHAPYIEVSAKTGENIDTLRELMKNCVLSRYLQQPRPPGKKKRKSYCAIS